jgi:hypothetical protein
MKGKTQEQSKLVAEDAGHLFGAAPSFGFPFTSHPHVGNILDVRSMD